MEKSHAGDLCTFEVTDRHEKQADLARALAGRPSSGIDPGATLLHCVLCHRAERIIQDEYVQSESKFLMRALKRSRYAEPNRPWAYPRQRLPVL